MSIIGLSKLESVDLVIGVTSIQKDVAKTNRNNPRYPKIVTREINNNLLLGLNKINIT